MNKNNYFDLEESHQRQLLEQVASKKKFQKYYLCENSDVSLH